MVESVFANVEASIFLMSANTQWLCLKKNLLPRRDGKKLKIVFGKIGTNGQTTEKSFSDSEEATKEMEKLIKSKLKKGYVEKTR